MKLRVLFPAMMLAAISFSCADDQPAAQTPAAAGTLAAAPAPAPAAHPVPSANTMVAPPKDARYTIFCQSITGAGHTDRANQEKALWQQATGRRDWYVIHQESESNLYFGYYRSVADAHDPGESKRVAVDREMISNLKDSTGGMPFQQALVVPLDAPDPDAPPEWNLVNAKGYWSVEVASFNQAGTRKSMAVDAVRQARAQGIEAYYYHGPSVSSVCVGAWPAEAVKKQTSGVAEAADPDTAIMIAPGPAAAMLPEGAKTKEGQTMKVMHDQIEIVDPSLTATLQQYPVHSVNGYEDGHKPSVLVPIPHEHAEPTLSDSPPSDMTNTSSGTSVAPTPPPGGRLRSLGE